MLTEPIVDGAYYEREDGSIVGPAVPDVRFPGYYYLSSHYYWGTGVHTTIFGLTPVPDEPESCLTRRVYIVPTDPVEVVAELHRRSDVTSSNRTAGYRAAAELVAEKLGVK